MGDKDERVKRESPMNEVEIREKEVLTGILKREGNREFGLRNIKKALVKYIKALDLCPLK